MNSEYDMEPVYSDRLDPGLPYKYEVLRFSIDLIDLYLIELGTALHINMCPIRMGMCNSHTDDYAKGLSASIDVLQLKLFLNEASRSETNNYNQQQQQQQQDKLFMIKNSQKQHQPQRLSFERSIFYESDLFF